MQYFISYADPLKQAICKIIRHPEMHARWINTLSYLENCGARKIARCEHPTLVREEILKHASEEFRHAHYLKRQIGKVVSYRLEDYSPKNLLGGSDTLSYLNRLDLYVSRILTTRVELSKNDVKDGAYTLVTYAIELRAQELYPIYAACLQELNSTVRVNSIIMEEQEHLCEMQYRINLMQNSEQLLKHTLNFEGEICKKWINAIYTSSYG